MRVIVITQKIIISLFVFSLIISCSEDNNPENVIIHNDSSIGSITTIHLYDEQLGLLEDFQNTIGDNRDILKLSVEHIENLADNNPIEIINIGFGYRIENSEIIIFETRNINVEDSLGNDNLNLSLAIKLKDKNGNIETFDKNIKLQDIEIDDFNITLGNNVINDNPYGAKVYVEEKIIEDNQNRIFRIAFNPIFSYYMSQSAYDDFITPNASFTSLSFVNNIINSANMHGVNFSLYVDTTSLPGDVFYFIQVGVNQNGTPQLINSDHLSKLAIGGSLTLNQIDNSYTVSSFDIFGPFPSSGAQELIKAIGKVLSIDNTNVLNTAPASVGFLAADSLGVL